MADEITFLEEGSHTPSARRTRQATSTGGIIGFMMRKGWVTSPQQANVILIAVIAICAFIIIYLNTGGQSTVVDEELFINPEMTL